MHKVEKVKYILLGSLISSMVFGTASVSAGSLAKQITAVYSNIQVYVDGVLVKSKDANGNKIEPFTYNGTTYLPIRAVSEALGKPVKWNGATQSVHIGIAPGEVKYLLDVVPPYKSDAKNYVGSKGETFTMGGKAYSNGFVIGNYSTKAVYFNLDNRYTEITGELGCVSWDATMSRNFDIYLDGEFYQSIEVKTGDLPIEVNIPVSGVQQLKIVSPYNGAYGTNGDTYIGFGDVKIK